MGQPILISKPVILRLVRDNPLYWTPGRAITDLEHIMLTQYAVIMISTVPPELDTWLLKQRVDLLDKWRIITTAEAWDAQARRLHPVTSDYVRPIITPDFPTALDLVETTLGPDHELTNRLAMYIDGIRLPDHDPRVR